MKIAIMGATSFIAQELLRQWVICGVNHEIHLYARDVEKVNKFINDLNYEGIDFFSLDLNLFPMDGDYDAVINFIGVGDPAKAKKMGGSILSITSFYDDLVISYLKNRPSCKYLFLSSGAVYGHDFSKPATPSKMATFNINSSVSSEKYSLAKFITEVKHRDLQHLSIVDIRVFSFFSRNQDLSTRFFLSDLVRAIQSNKKCEVSAEVMVRDYLHPEDFKQIIDCILSSPKVNLAVDCYSAGEIDKFHLLAEMENRFGLQYCILDNPDVICATGNKVNYFSKNNRLAEFGFIPKYTSLENIVMEVSAILGTQ